jgi:sugar phosphate permease
LTAAFYVGSGVLSPILTVLANWWSWRSACLTYGIGSGAVIIILAKVVIRDTPESMGLHPDGESPHTGKEGINHTASERIWNTREALGTFSFWMTFVGYCLLGIPGQGLLGHIVFWGVELGAPKAIGGVLLTAYAVTTAVTAIFGGWLADKVNNPPAEPVALMWVTAQRSAPP